MNAQHRLLSDSDLVLFLNLKNAQTPRRWRVQGRGPVFVRVGNRVRYRQADVEAWLDANSASSTSDRSERP